MALIHLDTSYLIATVSPATPALHQIERWLTEHQPLATSSIAWSEFLNGPVSTVSIELVASMLENRIIPFDKNTARQSATLFNQIGRKRNLRWDCMIAASALQHQAPLATLNPEDFVPFTTLGLRLAS